MKCVVCNGETINNTCSKKCAGVLSYSKRYYKKLQERYLNVDKQNDIQNIMIQIAREFGTEPISVLELHGGGTFFRKVRKNFLIKKHITFDCDPKLAPILNIIKKEYNDCYTYNKKIIDTEIDVNMRNIDVIYLDYCGWWNEEKYNEVCKLLKNQNNDTYRYRKLLVILTLNRSREHYKGASEVFAKDFDEHLWMCMVKASNLYFDILRNPIYSNSYTNGTNIMNTYCFKYGMEYRDKYIKKDIRFRPLDNTSVSSNI